MTSSVSGQRLRNVFVSVAVILVVLLSLAGVLSLVLGRTIAGCLRLSLACLFGAMYLAFVTLWLYGRKTGGRVLLDCGPYPTWWVFLVFGLIIVIDRIPHGSLASSWSKIFETVVLSSFFVIGALGRLQIRENGIWQYWGLLRWSSIKSYHWGVDSTLLISQRGLFSFLGLRGVLPFPPQQKQAVDDLLMKFCPNSQVA